MVDYSSGEIQDNNGDCWESIALEKDIITPSVGNTGCVYVYRSNRMWSQVKTAGSAIYANRHYLALYRERQPERLANSRCKTRNTPCKIIGDVFIHQTAQIDPTCVVHDELIIDTIYIYV